MLDKIELDSIRKAKRYPAADINTNSKLLYNKDIIYKLPHVLNPNLEDVLNYIDDCKIEELIELKSVIYCINKIVGYSFKNYTDYKSLSRMKSRDIDLKVEDSVNILKAFQKLNENDLKYADFHKGNVLINPITNDIKICDIDYMRIKDGNSISSFQLRNALVLSLAYLYDLKVHDISVVLKDNYGISKDIVLLKELNNLDLNTAIDIIKNIDLKSIPEERRFIKIRSKELSNTGYYNHDYL